MNFLGRLLGDKKEETQNAQKKECKQRVSLLNHPNTKAKQ